MSIVDPNGTLERWLAERAEINQLTDLAPGVMEYHKECLRESEPGIVRCPACGVSHVVDELLDPPPSPPIPEVPKSKLRCLLRERLEGNPGCVGEPASPEEKKV